MHASTGYKGSNKTSIDHLGRGCHNEKLAICVVCIRSVSVFDKTLRPVDV